MTNLAEPHAAAPPRPATLKPPAFKDLALAVVTYPDPTPDRAIRSGVALAARLGGELTVLTIRVDLPALHNPIANVLINLDRMAEEEEARSAATADLMKFCVDVAADEAGVPAQCLAASAKVHEVEDVISAAARTRDLCLLSVGPTVPASRGLAEAVLFGSGRPVLIFPEEREIAPSSKFRTIAIAWDGSARAARAMGDALPLLRSAATVRVLVVTGEKAGTTEGAARDLIRHLGRHDLDVVLDEQPAAETPIGALLGAYVAAHDVELLVMGGFGHSRLREFVLGGATAAMLEAPPCAVLMAH